MKLTLPGYDAIEYCSLRAAFFMEVTMKEIVQRKTLILSVISILCLIVGITYGAVAHDKMIVILSVIISSVNGYRIFDLHRIEKQKRFTTIEGICTDVSFRPFGKYRIIKMIHQDQTVEVSVPKSAKMKINQEYRLFFRQTDLLPKEGNDWLRNKILSENFLGYEEIGSDT